MPTTQLFTSCELYINDSDNSSAEQQLLSILAALAYAGATGYMIASLFRLTLIEGYRKYKTTLLYYFILLALAFAMRALHFVRIVLCIPKTLDTACRFAPTIVECVGTMSIISQLLDLVEIPCARLNMTKVIAALKLFMWGFIVASVGGFCLVAAESKPFDMLNAYMAMVTAISLEVVAFIYLAIVRRLRTGYERAYRKLSPIIWICVIISTVIFVARVGYHLARMFWLDHMMDILQTGGKVYYGLIVVLFPMVFQVAPIVVLNEYAMRYCRKHNSGQDSMLQR